MTQIFDDKGKVCPGTLVLAEPNKINLLRTKEKDGYIAAQISLGKKKKEFRLVDEPSCKEGDIVDVSIFSAGDKITVSGISKGRGFQGVVKRHGFHGGPRTHGQKHSEREPGSISGGGRAGGRVSKGLRMAGRMGSDRVTIKGLKVLEVDKDKNEILISGAVPGRRGTILELKGK